MPGITYTLGADNAQLIRAMEQAQAAVQGAFAKISSALGALGISFAAFKGMEGFVQGIEHVADTGKQLQTMSAITGASIKDLVTLRKAFKESGLEADGVQGALVRMQKALGGVNEEGLPTGHVFAQLGLNIRELQAESPVEAMRAIGAAVSALGNDSLKTSKVMEIFGREGAELKALFADPAAMEEAARSMGMIGDIYQRNGENFRHLANSMEALKSRVSGFFVGFTDQITPVILPMIDKLKNAINFVELGRKAGELVREVDVAFEQGKVREILSLSFTIAARGAGNELNRAFAAAVGALSVVREQGFWDGVTAQLVAAALDFGAELQRGGGYVQAWMDYLVYRAAHLSFGEALQIFSSDWVQALLNPVAFLGAKLAEIAIHFGQAIYAALHGKLGEALAEANALTQAKSAGPEAEAAFRAAMAKKHGEPEPQKTYADFLAIRMKEADTDRANMHAQATAARATVTFDPLAAMRDKMAEGLKLPDAFDAAGPIKQLAAIVEGLHAAAKKMGPVDPGDQPAHNGVAMPETKLPEGKVDTLSDRLSKIGLFIGGAGGPRGERIAQESLDIHRKILQQAERQTPLLDAIEKQRAGVFVA